jgi:hypothetical protein
MIHFKINYFISAFGKMYSPCGPTTTQVSPTRKSRPANPIQFTQLDHGGTKVWGTNLCPPSDFKWVGHFWAWLPPSTMKLPKGDGRIPEHRGRAGRTRVEPHLVQSPGSLKVPSFPIPCGAWRYTSPVALLGTLFRAIGHTT